MCGFPPGGQAKNAFLLPRAPSCPCPPKALEISKAGEDQESPWTKQYKSVQNGICQDVHSANLWVVDLWRMFSGFLYFSNFLD